MTWPAVLFWILIAAGFVMRGPLLLLYLFYAFIPFGTLVMVPGDVVGSINLLPHSFCALFLVVKLLLRPNALTGAAALAVNPQKLGILALFLLWSLFTAYVMPRLFMSHVDVIPIVAVVPDPQPLAPTTANFTQSAYMSLSTAMVFVFAIAAEDSRFRQHFLRANLLGGVILIITGLLDLGTQGTDVLAPFRNATYALLTDAEIFGSKRVVGLMPEASAYGSACVGFLSTLIFLRPSFRPHLRQKTLWLAILGLIVMALMSKSSTAYVGLAILSVAYGVNVMRRLTSSERASRLGLKWELAFLASAALILFGLVVFNPSMFDPFSNMVDTLIFQKTSSESYIERSEWTRYGWEALLATHGWGVGLGSVRTSNWYVSILSNTGVIGGLLMGSFMLQCFLRRARKDDADAAEMLTGLKLSLIPSLIMGALAGTTPDFGAGGGAAYGMITALSTMGVRRGAARAAEAYPIGMSRS